MKANKQIKQFLERNITYSYNAPSLYKQLKGKIPMNTIRSELRRLYNDDEINFVSRGFYQAKVNQSNIDLLENPPTKLHAITINCDCPKLQKLREGLTSPNCRFSSWMDFLEWLEFEKFKVSSYSRGDKKQYSKVIWYDDRDVHLGIHQNCKIDIFIGCSKHPIDYFEFRDIYNRINGYLDCINPFVNECVSQIGINKDFKEFDLDGVSSLRLKDFSNAWFQIYRKESVQCIRFECHLNPKPKLDLRDAYTILESFSRPVSNGYVHKEDERRDVV